MQINGNSRTLCFDAFQRVLTKGQVKEIYEFHLAESQPSSQELSVKRTGSTSSRLAERYGVSSKTIRDIWNGRTWRTITAKLVGNDEQQSNQKAILDFMSLQVILSDRSELFVILIWCNPEESNETWPTTRLA